MSDKKIRFMVTAAVMAALTYVATTVVRIPAPTGGYVHMGDGLVLLCGWILGPWWGGAAAGIGSMLVDLLGGYMSFVPGTLVIKFLDAMAAALGALAILALNKYDQTRAQRVAAKPEEEKTPVHAG